MVFGKTRREWSLASVGRVALCLVWFALLWRGWLKMFQNNFQGGGSLVSSSRFAFSVLVGLLYCGRGG